MKYLLYALWISVIFLGVFIYPCVPNDFRYIFAFTIGCLSEVLLMCAKGK